MMTWEFISVLFVCLFCVVLFFFLTEVDHRRLRECNYSSHIIIVPTIVSMVSWLLTLGQNALALSIISPRQLRLVVSKCKTSLQTLLEKYCKENLIITKRKIMVELTALGFSTYVAKLLHPKLLPVNVLIEYCFDASLYAFVLSQKLPGHA